MLDEGAAAGGHRECHIVSFEDHWTQFRDVLSPIDLLADITVVEESERDISAAREARGVAGLSVDSWRRILEVSRAIRLAVPDPDVDVFEAVPAGLFVLDYEEEGSAVSSVVHVYEHQRTCWEALFAFLRSAGSSLMDVTAQQLEEEFFADCDAPLPPKIEIDTLLRRAQKGEAPPDFVSLTERDHCHPHALARQARDNDLRESEIEALLRERNTQLARVIYRERIDFRKAFDDAMRELKYPEAAPPPKGTPIFESLPSNFLRSGGNHDLSALFAEIMAAARTLVTEPLTLLPPLHWTRRPMKGWFGMAHHRGRWKGQIRINCLLNSPDFSEETLRFLRGTSISTFTSTKDIRRGSESSSGGGQATRPAIGR